MVDPSIPQTGSTLLEDTRERAYQWGGQLGQLFGWLLVINFGLVGVGLGVITTLWPETPEFLASAAGAWLLLLAGCRGFAVLTKTGRPDRGARSIAVVEAAFCVGTGFVLLHADWPSRPAAVPTALTFSAAIVAACAVLDAAVARFGPRADARRHLIRAGGWLVAALLLMALLSTSPAAALASAAVLVGTAEIIQGGLLVGRANQNQADADDDQFVELWKD